MLKLLFNKNVQGEVIVQIQDDLVTSDFDYVKFINSLLNNGVFETQFDGVNEDEKTKLNEMLDKIKEAINNTNEEQQE